MRERSILHFNMLAHRFVRHPRKHLTAIPTNNRKKIAQIIITDPFLIGTISIG